jgi:hypothetical protein
VTRRHRGHRLSLLVKSAMLEWLAQAEPAVRRIAAGNAPANRYMIAINGEPGFEPLAPMPQGYEVPLTTVLGQEIGVS